jgi:uncharacterized membrane protein YvlD (DUF360 family)
MLRFLASVALHLLANAVGLAIAAWLLDGFSVSATAFIGVVILFTVVEIVLEPLVTKLALQHVSALRGGVALAVTLIGLIIATLVSDGLTIDGLTAWLGGVLAAVVLPLFLFKKTMAKGRERRA